MSMRAPDLSKWAYSWKSYFGGGRSASDEGRVQVGVAGRRAAAEEAGRGVIVFSTTLQAAV
jgi:hypothetical protein